MIKLAAAAFAILGAALACTTVAYADDSYPGHCRYVRPASLYHYKFVLGPRWDYDAAHREHRMVAWNRGCLSAISRGAGGPSRHGRGGR
jgi:hypothetical protein